MKIKYMGPIYRNWHPHPQNRGELSKWKL